MVVVMAKWRGKDGKPIEIKHSNVARQLLLEGKLLETCGAWGNYRLLELGKYVYEELAKAMASKLVPVLTDAHDNPFRGMTHILMLWEKGFFKSTLIKGFLGQGEHAGNGMVHVTTGQSPLKHRHFFKVAGTHAITAARFRGSFADGVFLPPFPAVLDIINVDELVAFMGTGDARTEMLANLNSIIEDGRGSTALVKMAAMTGEEIKEEWRDKIWINHDTKVLEYMAGALMVVATHHLEPRLMSELDSNGFLSRMKILSIDYDAREKLDFLRRMGYDRSPPTIDEEIVRDAWSILYGVKFAKRIAAPPNEYVDNILGTVEQLLNDYPGKYEGAINAISGRMRGAIQRDLVTHALLQQFTRLGTIPKQINELIYTDDDLKYASEQVLEILASSLLIQEQLDSFRSKKGQRGNKSTKSASAKTYAKKILENAYPKWVMKKDIVSAIKKRYELTGSVIYKVLDTMLEEELVESEQADGPRKSLQLRLVIKDDDK
jgi:hypothetical protein